MGLELTTDTTPIRVAHGFLVVGEKQPHAINPEQVTELIAERLCSSAGDAWKVGIITTETDSGQDPAQAVVVDFAELLAKLEKALKQRRR